MKILIDIEAYNEEASIADTIKDLREHNFGYDIVLIDNGSYDDTVEIAREMGIDVIAHCINSGGPPGVNTTSFTYAFLKQYDIFCQFDGDGQHIASELPKIIEPIKNNEADYVYGSRFLEKDRFQSYFFRRIGIKLFSYLVSKIVGYKITDITSGFRAHNKKVIELFAKQYQHELFSPSQRLIICKFVGAKIKEIPVKMKERKHGKSFFNFKTSIVFPLKELVIIVGIIIQKSKIKEYLRK